MDETVTCDECGEPVRLEDAHNPHDEGCRARNHPRLACDCDRWVHSECCRECQQDGT
jgi:hypothetical protein